MSIQSEVTRLQAAKNDIAAALTDAGAAISEANTLDEFADIIRLLTATIDSTLSSDSTNPIQNKAVYQAINNIKPTTTTGTLAASGWSNGTYSFESTYPVATYDVSIQPNGDSITAEQLEAWGAAMIVGSATTNKVKALGDVPTVNIPIIITIRKK